ncbi:MAG: signal peptide peptidase SppA [Deltaproteobacteria bacterium]|nr:signal peptide peptidase SppA [Deltaproteobacteria bacterium]MBW2011866.1 signal peptide peptidase SppA [Deltaproteobacteria bacterium]
MFSRRHPYLFFILVFSTLITGTMITLSLLFTVGSKSYEFEFGEKVGVIEIKGVILESKKIIDNLKKFREEDSIKAIVLRIDSPGGGVGPSQEIFREVRKTVKSKKVITSMGSVAASGGYYIAAASNKIVANPGTITGSIGVVMGYTNFQELLAKIGLVPVVVKSGEYKDMGSPVRKMTEKERNLLQAFVNTIHSQFVSDVAEGRGMDPGKVEKIADGSIFSGEKAKSLGMVDRLGNLEDAIEWAGRMAGIKGKVSAVYLEDKKFSLKRYIEGSFINNLVNRAINSNLYAAYLYRPGG